jgi:hypothetical protein
MNKFLKSVEARIEAERESRLTNFRGADLEDRKIKGETRLSARQWLDANRDHANANQRQRYWLRAFQSAWTAGRAAEAEDIYGAKLNEWHRAKADAWREAQVKP